MIHFSYLEERKTIKMQLCIIYLSNLELSFKVYSVLTRERDKCQEKRSTEMSFRGDPTHRQIRKPTLPGQVKVKRQSRCRHWKSNRITCEEIWSVLQEKPSPRKGFRNGSADSVQATAFKDVSVCTPAGRGPWRGVVEGICHRSPSKAPPTAKPRVVPCRGRCSRIGRQHWA